MTNKSAQFGSPAGKGEFQVYQWQVAGVGLKKICNGMMRLACWGTIIVMPNVYAEAKPLWEAGVGMGMLSMPDYAGSERRSTYVFPIPYLIYRGEILKVDRNGIYGDLFAADRLKLNVTFNAGVPVKSRTNGVRQGMPDLDPTFEVGPSVQWLVHKDDSRQHEWSLRFNTRAVIATDFSRTRTAGWAVNPHINFDANNAGPAGGWETGFALGPVYATERYTDYYYEVAPEYETVSRPAYDARGGYAGMRLGLTLSKRFPRYWFGAFARYDNLSGSVIEQSPLVQTRHALLVGAGLSWIMAVSPEMVQVDE